MHSAVPSKFLVKPRDVMAWLPPSDETEREKRYPVLYLQDGANVYIEWRVDEVAKPLIASQQIEPLIIVLVPNGGGLEDRYDDYTPTRPAMHEPAARPMRTDGSWSPREGLAVASVRRPARLAYSVRINCPLRARFSWGFAIPWKVLC